MKLQEVRKTLYNEELHNLYPLPSIIRMIKSKRIGEEGQDVGWWIILK
jgi:hypothetical protein